jgi:8-oxo-dGTP pyrophosphatase MutT (NUDIX family)
MHRLEKIRDALSGFEPHVAEDAERQAAVALLLREGERGLEVLVIRRAEKSGDPWSGHMALPGGRREPEDATVYETSRRETLEEVGIDISRGEYLGRLDDVAPRRMPGQLAVSTTVVAIDDDPGPLQQQEVEEAFWVPLEELVDEPVEIADWPGRWPAFVYDGHYVIWGLTHRILCQLRSLLAENGG